MHFDVWNWFIGYCIRLYYRAEYLDRCPQLPVWFVWNTSLFYWADYHGDGGLFRKGKNCFFHPTKTVADYCIVYLDLWGMILEPK